MDPRMHLHVLASGSKGNAALVEGPGGSVLIDCGISRRELLRRASELGVDVEGATAAIITHEHSDHTRGLPVFYSHFEGELFATAGTASGHRDLASLPLNLVSHHETFELAGMVVSTFPTSHDVADPMGLRFSVVDGAGEVTDAIGWCTDTGFLTADALGALRDVRILGIESNHDTDMLAHGPYPAFLRARVGGELGHLSNAQCAEALPLLVGDETETVVALHLSEKNNRPAVCVRALASALGAEPSNDDFTEARTTDGHVSVCCASQVEPLTVW
ncbi:MAG: MBL fold metallo-hydrolase [Olsenella sp.]|nr:MBL fold metallo-hydrolase [Olsenella sp.]